MRPHKRDLILDAAFEVLERDGLAGLTIEAVADSCGLTRAGVQYHYSSREALFQAVQERRAVRWGSLLLDELGSDPEKASVDERLAAYVRVSSGESASVAELLLMLEASRRPEHKRPYGEVAQRWLPETTDMSPDDPVAMNRLLAIVAADGLWVSDTVGERIPSELRVALAAHINALIGGESLPPGPPPT